MTETRLGEMLLEHGFLRQEQLEHILQIQAFSSVKRPIGEILIEHGIVSQRMLTQLLKVQDRRRLRHMDGPQRPLSATPGDGNSSPESLLDAARRVGASDLFLSEDRPPRVRIAADVVDLAPTPVTGDQLWSIIQQLMGTTALEEIHQKKDLLLCSRLGGIRYRAALSRDLGGLSLTIRIVPERVPVLSELGLPSHVHEMLKLTRGLILLTGSVGSGRTTTLRAMIGHLNESRRARILVIEQSAEIDIPSKESLITYRRPGYHTKTFTSALRATLRTDVDVLVVDPLLEAEAVDLALQRAIGGGLVIASVPALDTVRALHRLVDAFRPDEQSGICGKISSVLRGAVAQKLMPQPSGNGRVLACEVFVPNAASLRLLRERKFNQIPMVMQINKDQGCITMDESLSQLAALGKISQDDLLLHALDKPAALKALEEATR